MGTHVAEGPASSPKSFWQEQTDRLAVRWFVVQHALFSTAFWTLVILAVAWLRHFGVGFLIWPAAVVWFYLALPGLLLDAQLILDAANYGLTKTVYFFPILLAMATADVVEQRMAQLTPTGRQTLRRLLPLFRVAHFTSPIIGPATWCFVVLLRTPEHLRQPKATVREEIRETSAIGRRMTYTVSEGYAERQLAWVGGQFAVHA